MEEKLPHIIGINGSPRADGKGLCESMLRTSLETAVKHGADARLVHLAESDPSIYHSYLERKPEKDFEKLARDIYGADGLIIATPVLWHGMSALTKNFVEKLTCLEQRNYGLEGTVAGFIAVHDMEGGWKTTLDLAGPFNHMGVLIPPYSTVFYNSSLAKTRKGRWMKRDVELLGKNMAVACRMVRQSRPIWDYKGEFRKKNIDYKLE